MRQSFVDQLNSVADKLDLPRPEIKNKAGDVNMMTVRFGDVAEATIGVCDDKPLSEIIASIVLLNNIQWKIMSPLREHFEKCLSRYGATRDELFFDEPARTLVSCRGKIYTLPQGGHDKENVRLSVMNHVISSCGEYALFHHAFESMRKLAIDNGLTLNLNGTHVPLRDNMHITDCAPLNSDKLYVDILLGRSGESHRCHSPEALRGYIMWAVHHQKLPDNIKRALNKYRTSDDVHLMDWDTATGAYVTVDGKGPFIAQSGKEIEEIVDRINAEKE